jgi:hypothetical protein
MKKKTLLLTVLLAALFSGAKADVDPNFYFYICFGQSNMEGNAQWESMDNTVDSRFQLLATTNFSSPSRTKGKLYKALPPLVSPWGKLGPSDYFGRTMVAALPPNVKVGVIPVAMGGSPIEMFDKDSYKQKMKDNPNELWTNLANQYYGGNPYGRIIEMAKEAQKVGVIKGILLHQGCSNNTQQDWPDKVKKIYNDMLTDLGLDAADVPLFVGETEYQDQGGSCWGHNAVIAKIPSAIKTGHVVSAKGVPGNGTDPWHFSALGYRILGKRYALEALKVMGLDAKPDAQYTMSTALKKFYGAKSIAATASEELAPGDKISVTATFNDGHKEDVSDYVTFRSDDIMIKDGKIVGEGNGVVEVAYTDFCNQETTTTLNVKVVFFPINASYLKQRQGTVKVDFDTRTITFSTTNAQAGWMYNNPVDLSAYKYLVFKLKEPQTLDAEIRMYKRNGTSLSLGYREVIGDRTIVAIDLHHMEYNNKTMDPANVGKIVFHSPKKGTLSFDDIFLSNDESYAVYTDINEVNSSGNSFKAPLYSLDGRLVQPDALKPGFYIQAGKKTVIR